jgi:hypothetical protein
VIEMTLASEQHIGTEGDALDQLLAASWRMSDIAVDVFGMFFWATLALLLMRGMS